MLGPDEMKRIVDAAIEAGLASGDRRRGLLCGLPPAVAARLPEHRRPADQLRSDLSDLAALPDGQGVEHPLSVWLRNAKEMVAPRPEAQVFADALDWLDAAAVGSSGHPTPDVQVPAYMTRPRSQPPRPPRGMISHLLVPRYAVVPFAGREDLLQDLDMWADADDAAVGVRLLHGPGGAGKTRLALEWLKRRPVGAVCGLLSRSITSEVAQAIARTECATLVIDYAESRPGLFGLLQRLAVRLDAETPGRLRVLLLARNAGDWWASLRERDGGVCRVLDDAPRPVRHLRPMVDADGRAAEFLRAATAFAAHSGRSLPADVPDLTDRRFDQVLYLHMAALAAVDGLDPRADTLLDALLAHEKRMWIDHAGIDRDDAHEVDEFLCSARAVLGAATLRGGLPDKPAAEAIAKRFCAGDDQARRVVRALRVIYPSPRGWIGPLEPDLLGEVLVGGLLDDRAYPNWPVTAAARLEVAEAEAAFTVLGRLEDRFSDLVRCVFTQLLDEDFSTCARGAFAAALALGERTAHSHLGLVLARALDARGDVELAARFYARIPERTTMLLEVGLWTTRMLLPTADGAERLRLLRGCTRLTSRLGQHRAALAYAEQAVEFCRRGVDTDPAESGRDLAVALTNFSVMLSNLGRHDEALAAAEQSIAVAESQAADDPVEATRLYAFNQLNLGLHLARLGRLHEATEAAREAVEAYRRLAAECPDEHHPDLAMATNNLGAFLSDQGQWAAALALTAQTVGMYRTLAVDRPDAFLPELALSLLNRGRTLAASGRWSDAVSCAEEAVAAYRRLADDRPTAFLPELARSLLNLGHLRSSLGRSPAALAATKEAVALYRRFVADHPDTHRPEFALALNNLGRDYWALGQADAALVAIEEATDLTRALVAALPLRFEPDLARVLTNLGQFRSDLGRPGEALATTEEAVALHRRLVAVQREAHLPGLALALGNLANQLQALDRTSEAIVAAEESLRLYRRLEAERPAAFGHHFARGLGNLGILLAGHGRWGQAAAVTDAAIHRYRSLTVELPGAVLPELANCLSNLSLWRSHLGQRHEALAAATEAASVCRRLAADRPDAPRLNFARALTNLCSTLANLGRAVPALVAIDEAIEQYRQMKGLPVETRQSELGRALVNRCLALAATDRPGEALVAVDEAIRLFRLSDLHAASARFDLGRALAHRGRCLLALEQFDSATEATGEATHLLRPLAELDGDLAAPELARALVFQGLAYQAVGAVSAAAEAFDDAIRTLWPAFGRRSAALAPQMRNVLDARAKLVDRVPSPGLAADLERFAAVVGQGQSDPRSD